MARTIYEAIETAAFFLLLVGTITGIIFATGKVNVTFEYSLVASLLISFVLLLFLLPIKEE